MSISVYVHIPYCAQKCGYCDFNSYAGSESNEQSAYVRALLQEMQLWARRPEVAIETVSTIFVGGGTPTLLEPTLLREVITAASQIFRLEPSAEVTVEANPGTIDVEGDKLAAARAAGANRLSFGVQAYQPHLLQRLGRIHTADQVEASVRIARSAGFQNINLDLMYGLPGQTVADFRETLAWALSLRPTHVSAYSLIIEEGTPFAVEHAAHRLTLPPEEAEEAMYQECKRVLVGAGFDHYEVSNYALPGYRSRHNQVYWRNEPYLGLGCGAHSFLTLQEGLSNLQPPTPRLTASRVQGGANVGSAVGNVGDRYRFWNLKTPAAYRQALNDGRLPVETGEVIGLAAEMAETMIMGLRLLHGVSEARFVTRFGRTLDSVYGDQLRRLETAGLVVRTEKSVRLSDYGLRVANQVWEAFLP